MYIASQRVRTPRWEEGINAFFYTHGAYVWAVPPLPEQDPGILINSLLSVDEVGGNVVRSYLDIVTSDGQSWMEIHAYFLQFLELWSVTVLPWASVIGPCLFRLDMEPALARNWQHEVDLLYRACVLVQPPA